MKNYWLDKKKGGFPQDDEFSKVAGCCGDFACNCSANLDIFYGSQFVQNEEIYGRAIERNESKAIWKTEFTPILRGTMFGKVYMNGAEIYDFSFCFSGSVVLKQVNDSEMKILRINLKEATGEIETWWDKLPILDTIIKVNYEFIR
jgi:hypothetical protein